MGKWRSQRWDEMSPARKVAVMLAVSLRVSLTVAALTDLAQRPAAQINGRKWRWAAAILLVDFFGPIAYYRRGRRPGS